MSDRINIVIDWGEILRQSKKKTLSERNSTFKTDRKYRTHRNALQQLKNLTIRALSGI